MNRKEKTYKSFSLEEALFGWIGPRYRNEVIVGLAVIVVAFAINHFADKNAPALHVESITLNKPEVEQTSVKQYKQELLRKNFSIKMENGAKAFREKDYKLAIEEFFHAKSIYPYEFQPRYLLSQTFYTYCKEEGRYCGNAIREVSYAFNYVPESSLAMNDKLMAMNDWLKDYKRKKLTENSGLHEVYGVQNLKYTND